MGITAVTGMSEQTFRVVVAACILIRISEYLSSMCRVPNKVFCQPIRYANDSGTGVITKTADPVQTTTVLVPLGLRYSSNIIR